jgi:pimeloyl-ACP methyl ester carboxylesterase
MLLSPVNALPSGSGILPAGVSVMEVLAMLKRRTLLGLGLVGGAALAGGGLVTSAYGRAMARARAAISPERSRVIESRFGAMEYAEAGTGTPFLMVHGTGGGFDQGLMFADRLVKAGFRVIAPSRFGYLRTAFPDDPSSENQADAFVDLLDALGIEKIAIAGGSAGALSAMQFAIRHPDRCAALLPIVPAAYAPDRPPARPWSPTQQSIAQNVLQSDFLFWAAISAMRETIMETLLATDAEVYRTASPAEQARARAIMFSILPVSTRAWGLLNDGKLAGNPQRMALETVTAPTLAISLQDDRFLTVDAARHIAATVPSARLVVYPTGGHIWLGHDEDLFGEIVNFLKEIGYT